MAVPSMQIPVAENTNITTIWMGNVRPHMDENYIKTMLGNEPEVKGVKMCRDKHTGGQAPYCFVDFNSHEAAKSFIERSQGQQMPNGEGFYKLNWAAKEYVPGQPIANLETGTLVPTDMFVGDVAPEVTEATLSQLISHTFPTMQSVKLMVVPGRPVNFGFVKFATEAERDLAITKFDGMQLGSRQLKCSKAVRQNHQQREPRGYNMGGMYGGGRGRGGFGGGGYGGAPYGGFGGFGGQGVPAAYNTLLANQQLAALAQLQAAAASASYAPQAAYGAAYGANPAAAASLYGAAASYNPAAAGAYGAQGATYAAQGANYAAQGGSYAAAPQAANYAAQGANYAAPQAGAYGGAQGGNYAAQGGSYYQGGTNGGAARRY